MDIHSLTYFKKVADLQHLTRAANELRVAQPSLSRTIAALEDELGVRLFDRVGRNISLNRCGEIVLRHTNRILQELDDIRAELADETDEADRTVTFSSYAASKLLPNMVMAFKQKYPHIRLQIVQEGIPGALNPDCDLSIYSSISPCSNDNEVNLLEEEIFLALPESSPLAQFESVSLRDAASMDFICLQKGKSLRSIADAYCKMAGFEPNVVLESDNPETVRSLIRAGLGIALIPEITWRGTETEQVVLRPISFPECKRYIHLSWKATGYLSPSALLFRDFVKDYFAVLSK